MLKEKTKELIVCIISVIALILAITTNVFANSVTDLNELLGNNNNNEENYTQILNEKTPNNVVPNNVVPNNTANTMPNAGVSYSSIIIIAITSLSAIYAYKKIKDYNNF